MGCTSYAVSYINFTGTEAVSSLVIRLDALEATTAAPGMVRLISFIMQAYCEFFSFQTS